VTLHGTWRRGSVVAVAPSRMIVALALAITMTGCERCYSVRADARPAASGWIRVTSWSSWKDVAIRDDRLGKPVQLFEHGPVRMACERWRHPRALVVGIFSVLLGTGLVGAAIAIAVPGCVGVRCSDGPRDAAIFGSIGGVLSLGGASMLWWAWPARIHTEPLSAHPEL
jgi:hypothetical protein